MLLENQQTITTLTWY